MADPTQKPDADGKADAGSPAAGEATFTKEGIPWWEKEIKQSVSTPEAQERILGKIRGYEKDYARMKEEYAQALREAKDAVDTLKQHKPPEQIDGLDKARAKGGKVLDSMIESTTDPQTRETLRSLREIISEETETKALREELKSLKQVIDAWQLTTQTTQVQRLESELSKLSDAYGPLVDKHRDAILKYGTSYPAFSAEELLYKIAKPDELRQALVIQARSSKGAEQTQKKPAASVASEERPLHEQFKGKTASETSSKFRDLVLESVKQTRAKQKVGFSG